MYLSQVYNIHYTYICPQHILYPIHVSVPSIQYTLYMYLSPGATYQITPLSHRYTLYSALHDPYPTFYTVITSKQDFDLVLKIGT